MNFQGAFECADCPRNSDAAAGRACPAWWETVFTHPNGDVRVEKACGWVQLPKFLVEVIKASNRPAAEISKMTNEIITALDRMEAPPAQFAGPQLIDTGLNRLPIGSGP